MSSLGEYIWRLVVDPKMAPADRHSGAWQLWREAPKVTPLATSRLAALCVYQMAHARGTGQAVAPEEPPEWAVAAVGDRETQLALGHATWNHIAALFTSLDVGAEDPSLTGDLERLDRAFQGDAVFLFALWGNGAVGDFARRDPAHYADRMAWLRQQYEAF